MAYKIVLTAIFMVLVSVAIARPQAAREDAKNFAALKDFIMADQRGMIFHSAGNPPKPILLPISGSSTPLPMQPPRAEGCHDAS